ncbi:MAG TPA: isocitrate lyase/phosphoenolpyruvate mutase family protein [Candidatus Binatia bacterium]|jgi:methylisocitrate lyase
MSDNRKRVRLHEILAASEGAIAPGITDPLFARLVQDSGYSVIHLSGNAIHKTFCLPDRDLVTVTEIATRAARISEVTDVPLIVDAGTCRSQSGYVARAVRVLERAGAAAIRFEDSAVGADEGNIVQRARIRPKNAMVQLIKAAADARADRSLVIVARCDARRVESLEAVQERLGSYAEAGADAVGVQISDPEELFEIGRNAPRPLVSLWPRNKMSALQFLQSGFRVALMPSSVSLAAVAAARQMLIELMQNGTERDYFGRIKDIEAADRWYRTLGDG